jgi:hypothetical protein
MSDASEAIGALPFVRTKPDGKGRTSGMSRRPAIMRRTARSAAASQSRPLTWRSSPSPRRLSAGCS